MKGSPCFLQLSLPLGWQVLRGDEEQLRRDVGYIRDQSGELLLDHMGGKHLGLNPTASPSLFARRRGHNDQASVGTSGCQDQSCAPPWKAEGDVINNS